MLKCKSSAFTLFLTETNKEICRTVTLGCKNNILHAECDLREKN